MNSAKQVGIVCMIHGHAEGYKECPTCKWQRNASLMYATLKQVQRAKLLDGALRPIVDNVVKAATPQMLPEKNGAERPATLHVRLNRPGTPLHDSRQVIVRRTPKRYTIIGGTHRGKTFRLDGTCVRRRGFSLGYIFSLDVSELQGAQP